MLPLDTAGQFYFIEVFILVLRIQCFALQLNRDADRTDVDASIIIIPLIPHLQHLCLEAQRRVGIGHGDTESIATSRRDCHRCGAAITVAQLVGDAVAVHCHLGDGVFGCVAANAHRQVDCARPVCSGIRRIIAQGNDRRVGLVTHLRRNGHLNRLGAHAILVPRVIPDLCEVEARHTNGVVEAEDVRRRIRYYRKVAVLSSHDLAADGGLLDLVLRFNEFPFRIIPHVFGQLAEGGKAIFRIQVRCQHGQVQGLCRRSQLGKRILRRHIALLARQLEGQAVILRIDAQQLQQGLDVGGDVLRGIYDLTIFQRPLLLHLEIHGFQAVGDGQIFAGIRSLISRVVGIFKRLLYIIDVGSSVGVVAIEVQASHRREGTDPPVAVVLI